MSRPRPGGVARCYDRQVRSSPPTRLPLDVYEAASVAAGVSGRSTAQQLAYWARLGRELEASPGVSQRDVELILAGAGSYDDLSVREQAVVRESWDRGVERRIAALDLAAEFRAAGRSWTEADEHGHPVTVAH